jgi:hypothetical protein
MTITKTSAVISLEYKNIKLFLFMLIIFSFTHRISAGQDVQTPGKALQDILAYVKAENGWRLYAQKDIPALLLLSNKATKENTVSCSLISQHAYIMYLTSNDPVESIKMLVSYLIFNKTESTLFYSLCLMLKDFHDRYTFGEKALYEMTNWKAILDSEDKCVKDVELMLIYLSSKIDFEKIRDIGINAGDFQRDIHTYQVEVNDAKKYGLKLYFSMMQRAIYFEDPLKNPLFPPGG